VIRRYGFVLEPVLWQIVIFVAGVFVGAGVTVGDGHAAVPTTIASPVWRIWPPTTRPDFEFGFIHARLETVILRHGLESEPVLWQIVILLGGVTVCVVGSWPCAATARPASIEAAAAVAMNRRFTSYLLGLPTLSLFPENGAVSESRTGFAVPLQGFLCNSLTRE
jgi:hypothetical protein